MRSRIRRSLGEAVAPWRTGAALAVLAVALGPVPVRAQIGDSLTTAIAQAL